MSVLPPKAAIAVIHLPPLPGGVHNRCALDEIIRQVGAEADVLANEGFDALIVENFGDAPFARGAVAPHTVAMMTRCVVEAVSRGLPAGVNVLRNDARAALAVAAASDARFIRVNVHTGVYATDQGLMEGRAANTLQYRRRLGLDVAILADVHVKHARVLNQPDIALAAEETADRGGADGLIVSGATTGRTADLEEVRRVKQAVPGKPVLIGSGVRPDNVASFMEAADGVIVGSCLREDDTAGRALVARRCAAFIKAAKGNL